MTLIDADPTIAFRAQFFWHTAGAALCAAILFGLPGLTVLRALEIAPPFRQRGGRAPWLMAPAVGLCTFGPLSLLCTTLFGFSTGTILLSALFTCTAAVLFSRRLTTALPSSDPASRPAGIPAIATSRVILLMIAATLWALLPAMNLYPGVYKGGIYTNSPLADHVKIAFIDAIAREGMIVRNPFYAPNGQRILLSYSYGWYVMGAEVKTLANATGWQADVAMTWFTGFAIVSFLCALACGLTGKARAGFWVIFLALTGPICSDMLPLLLGERWLKWVGLPATHGLEVLWLQVAWAPQHAFAGLAVIVLIWLGSSVLAMERIQRRYLIVIGLAAAAAFESSTWVGGVALLAASPLLLLAAAMLRLPMRHYLGALKLLLPAALICIACSAPMLIALFSGSATAGMRPIGFAIFPTTVLENHLGLTGKWISVGRIMLFWVHLLPLSFGAIYLLGLPAMFAWSPTFLRERTFHALALASTIGFLLVSQFISSTIRANDLGWRAVNVPVMFLIVWAAVALTDLLRYPDAFSLRWRGSALLVRGREIFVALAWGLAALGVLATAHAASWPVPFSPGDLPLHKAFARQAQAWAIVRRYTKPTDLVQSNPDAFPTLTPWPINLPYHLFADRPTAYACIGTGKTYAFRYPGPPNTRQYFLVRDAFSAQSSPQNIRALHDRLHIKAILVTPADAVWASDVIERSRLYRLIARSRDYRIYIATSGRRRVTTSSTF